MRKLALLLLVLSFGTISKAQTNTARMLSGITNAAVNSDYTFVCTDVTKLVVFNNSNPQNANLFAVTDPCSGVGVIFSVKNLGSAPITIIPASGTINGSANLVVSPGQGADIYNDGISNYVSQGGGSGAAFPFPRLDQVIDPNQDKPFNLGTTHLSFINGNFSLIGTNLVLPNSLGCAGTATSQECIDLALNNAHLWNGSADNIVALFPLSTTFNDGDVLGASIIAGQQVIQDLGPVNAASGRSFLMQNNTSLLDGDIHCFDSTAISNLDAWPNCTPGAADNTVNGATSTYAITFANDQLKTIDHDSAGSQSVNVSLPTADTLGLNPGFVFVWSNHSTHADTITPTTWTINGSATQSIASNSYCRIRVNPNSATDWISDCAITSGAIQTVTGTAPIVVTAGANPVVSCPTCGVGSGNLSGALTAGKVPVASGAITLIDGGMLDDITHAVRDNKGFDVNSLGAFIYWIVNNAVTGTTVNKMVCNDGTGAGIICPFATSMTNDPLGSAVATNGAAPGTTGSTGICNIGFCTVVMDNAATANHYAQQSTTVAGDLSDVGTTPPTNGQPYWHIVVGNAGAGTTAVFRNMDSSELNASAGNGKTTVQINGVNTQPIANYATGGGITWSKIDAGNTSTITGTVAALATQYTKLRCETGLGDGLNAMPAGTYLQFFCVNTSGVTWTITGINCWTDNAGTSTLNAANNAATGLLTGAVTCNNTKSGGGAAGTQSGTTTIANNDAISFTFVADGTSKQTTWTVSLTQ